jgi:3-oxo-5alpha-steroid 4-dehydrogenase
VTTRQIDTTYDVVVIGAGAAGTVAAIQAAERGARVLVLDRWGRGGASARSGGVIYAGGGTPQQLAAGFDDDPDAMEHYLALEEGVDPDDALVRAFCERSRDDLEWLAGAGVHVPMGFDPSKAVVPTGNDTGLYYSGNERHHAPATPAAPRGHRVAGTGMTGRPLVDALHAAAADRGVTIRSGARLLGLVTDGSGRVVGVEVVELADDPITRAVHGALFQVVTLTGTLLRRVPAVLSATVDRFERRRGRVRRIDARHGVVLATGGFSFNHRMLAEHAPAYATAMPLGTAGDDGSGISLAQEIGAAVRLMDRCGASRFIAPPAAFAKGVLVDDAGERICDESLYAATLSARIAEHGGRGWLVVDGAIRDEVRDQIRNATRIRTRSVSELLSGRANHVLFPRLFGSINLYVNRRRADSLDELAARCAIPAEQLVATIDDYNTTVRAGGPDPMGKPAEHLQQLLRPPFAAVPCHLDGQLFPAPCITRGGLDVDPVTQQVRRADGSGISGLHAVGRCAAGIASRSYVSGLSLADCVFSGRNAGMAVTTQPSGTSATAAGRTAST